MRKILISIALLFAALQSYAYTEWNYIQNSAGYANLKSALIQNQKWVQYPSYTDRAGWDKFLGDWKEEFIARGEKRLDYEWRVVKATDYLEFERSGNRKIMENPFVSNYRAIAELFMAELAEGKGRFIDQLINGVFLSCEMTSWSFSAHLIAFQHSGRALPTSMEDVIDLRVGDIGSMLSWVYYYLHDEFDKVDPEISRRLRSELQRRVLDTYMNEDRFWWQAVNYKEGDQINNWTPWCNFNVLQCFLLLEDDIDALTAAAVKTIISTDKFINNTKSDGACDEGPSYWGHAAGKMYDFLQLLYDATGGKVTIFDNPMIRRMGEYISSSYVGDGWVVNFADASAQGGGDAPLVYRYGKAVDSQEMMGYAAYLNSINKQSAPTGDDIFRIFQTTLYRNEFEQAKPELMKKPYYWYPETGFCYMSNDKGLFFATKSGHNGESHNHNDIGTFSLYVDNTPVFIDAGVGTYTRQTFSNERYTIWTMQSDYHNLPVINGVSQKDGKKFKPSNVVFNPKKMMFSEDISGAYPEAANAETWVRSYTLKGGVLKISDKFELSKAEKQNKVNFLTWGDVDITVPGVIAVDVQGKKVNLSYDKNAFDASIETIRLDDIRLSSVWGSEIYRVTLTAKKTTPKGSYTYTVTKL